MRPHFCYKASDLAKRLLEAVMCAPYQELKEEVTKTGIYSET